MMGYIAALLPVAVYIIVVYSLDSFSLVSIRRLLVLILTGAAAALVCFGLFYVTGGFVPESVQDYTDPVVEELIKALPLLVLARSKKTVFFIDSIVCGAAVGGGFSILENLFYVVLREPLGVGTLLFRGLEVALIHMGCSAIISVALMFSVRLIERVRSKLAVKGADTAMAVFLLVAAPSLHILHNTLHTDPLRQFVIVFGSMALLLLLVYRYDCGMIHRWLDRGLDKQVSLLMSIKEGELGDTKTGKFLMSVKENFPSEVFFDLICYVQLYVELSVAAKSRFMMREAGMDIPIEDKDRDLYLSQYAEFKNLEKSLGKAARMTIAPVVKFYPADRKALDDLLEECRKSK